NVVCASSETKHLPLFVVTINLPVSDTRRQCKEAVSPCSMYGPAFSTSIISPSLLVFLMLLSHLIKYKKPSGPTFPTVYTVLSRLYMSGVTSSVVLLKVPINPLSLALRADTSLFSCSTRFFVSPVAPSAMLSSRSAMFTYSPFSFSILPLPGLILLITIISSFLCTQKRALRLFWLLYYYFIVTLFISYYY